MVPPTLLSCKTGLNALSCTRFVASLVAHSHLLIDHTHRKVDRGFVAYERNTDTALPSFCVYQQSVLAVAGSGSLTDGDTQLWYSTTSVSTPPVSFTSAVFLHGGYRRCLTLVHTVDFDALQ